MHRLTKNMVLSLSAPPLFLTYASQGYFNLACGETMMVSCMCRLHLLMLGSYHPLHVVSTYVCEDADRWPERGMSDSVN